MKLSGGDAKWTGSGRVLRGEEAEGERGTFGSHLGGSEPELVRQDRGAGGLRVAKLTNTGKSMSRRRRGLAETPALLLYALCLIGEVGGNVAANLTD